MSNFLYSINVTLPIFLIMVLGYGLRRAGMFGDKFISEANKFNFTVTLPVLLFQDLYSNDFVSNFDLKYVLFCAIVTSICFWGIWGLAKIFIRDKSIIGAFVQASFRSSAAVIGLAFIQNIYGSSTMGALMIIGTVPLYNIYSVIVLTFEGQPPEGEQRDTKRIKKAGINILKNPIIIGIVLGCIASVSGIQFPAIIDTSIGYVARIATPLALITLGAGFEGRKALAKIKPTIVAAVIKLVVMAGIFLPVAIAMGFRDEKIIALIVMLAAPTTPSCYIMAKNMHNDGTLTASVVVATTLLSSVTLTAWIWILRSLGVI